MMYESRRRARHLLGLNRLRQSKTARERVELERANINDGMKAKGVASRNEEFRRDERRQGARDGEFQLRKIGRDKRLRSIREIQSTNDISTTYEGEGDALDHVFSAVEHYVCGHEAPITTITNKRFEPRVPQKEDERQGLLSSIKSRKTLIPRFRPRQRRASKRCVVCSIRKKRRDEKTGLSFISFQNQKGVFISKIRDGSIASFTDLKEGMKLLTINGKECPERVADVIKLVKQSSGILVMVAIAQEDQVLSAIKESKQRKQDRSHDLFISRAQILRQRKRELEAYNAAVSKNVNYIKHQGLALADNFFKTVGLIEEDAVDEDLTYHSGQARDLQPVITADSENKKTSAVPPSPKDSPCETQVQNIKIEQRDTKDERMHTYATSHDKHSTELDEKREEPDVTMCRVFKRERKERLGISFVSYKSREGVFVYKIHENSIFRATDMTPGMKILCINGRPCPKRVGDALDLLKALKGKIVISAVGDDSKARVKVSAYSEPRKQVSNASFGHNDCKTSNSGVNKYLDSVQIDKNNMMKDILIKPRKGEELNIESETIEKSPTFQEAREMLERKFSVVSSCTMDDMSVMTRSLPSEVFKERRRSIEKNLSIRVPKQKESGEKQSIQLPSLTMINTNDHSKLSRNMYHGDDIKNFRGRCTYIVTSTVCHGVPICNHLEEL